MAKSQAGGKTGGRLKGRLHIGANLDESLVRTFRQQCAERDFNASKLFEKSMRRFTALDRDLQIVAYHGSIDPAVYYRRMADALEKKRRPGGTPPGGHDSAGPSNSRRSRPKK